MLVTMVIDGADVSEDPGSVDPAARLLAGAAEGSHAAFAELYDMLSPRLFGLIVRILVDRSQSEEVLQEVFLEIWQRAGDFDPDRGQARSWMLTIAHRRAIDRVRAAQANSLRDVRAGLRDLAGAGADVEEDVRLRIDGDRAAHALGRLPEPQREALTLAYFGGYSQREIAAIVGAPLGTLKTRMRDGLSRLRLELEVKR